MPKVKSMRVRCMHCKHEFPSPIFFEEFNDFQWAVLQDNTVQCGRCKKMTPLGSENVRISFEDGGYVGYDAT